MQGVSHIDTHGLATWVAGQSDSQGQKDELMSIEAEINSYADSAYGEIQFPTIRQRKYLASLEQKLGIEIPNKDSMSREEMSIAITALLKANDSRKMQMQ